ncbi:hypothetical protein AB0K60_07185 [Thermopolyspora sp. NPDC052614]
MTREDVQGYVQDLIAYNETRRGGQGRPKPPAEPRPPVRLPARPPKAG